MGKRPEQTEHKSNFLQTTFLSIFPLFLPPSVSGATQKAMSKLKKRTITPWKWKGQDIKCEDGREKYLPAPKQSDKSFKLFWCPTEFPSTSTGPHSPPLASTERRGPSSCHWCFSIRCSIRPHRRGRTNEPVFFAGLFSPMFRLFYPFTVVPVLPCFFPVPQMRLRDFRFGVRWPKRNGP